MKIPNKTFFESLCNLNRKNHKKYIYDFSVLEQCMSIKLDGWGYDVEFKNLDLNKFTKFICHITKLLPNGKYLLNCKFPNNIFELLKDDNGIIMIQHYVVEIDKIEYVEYIVQFDYDNETSNTLFKRNNKIFDRDDLFYNKLSEQTEKLFSQPFDLFSFNNLIEFILKPMIFIELSEKNVRFINVKSKTEYGNITKPLHVKNDSKVDIIFVNSLWNVGTIVLGEYKVRGHFRLQPYGENRNKIKLIFIEEFTKTQYVRKSKKELVG